MQTTAGSAPGRSRQYMGNQVRREHCAPPGPAAGPGAGSGPTPPDVTSRSAPLLAQLHGLLGRGVQCVLRRGFLQERVLDLLLGEAVPLVVPGRLDVRPRPRGPVLLAPHLQVPSGVLVDLD